MNLDFTNYKFRCSSLGAIMTDPRSKSEGLSVTCKDHLIECFIREKYGREKDISNKYIEKGLAVEEDSITLFSRVKKKFFQKNEHRITNDFITGEPDLFEGEKITEATHIIDLKSSWDIYTFFKAQSEKVNKAYYLQLQGYMALTGAEKSTLCYCLVNTPDVMIQDEKKKLLWKMGAATELDETYLHACQAIDIAMTFDDLPMEERVFEISIERDEDVIASVYERVIECRRWLNTFSSQRIIEMTV